MRTFIYKRTHIGDPDNEGCFGIQDCMGRLRNCEFEAVIGVGGVGAYAMSQNIDSRVNWIGVGARKEWLLGTRGPLVTFAHFVLFEENGPRLTHIAPRLARRMCSRRGPRFVFSEKLSPSELNEIGLILAMARREPPSTGFARHPSRRKKRVCDVTKRCGPKRRARDC